MKDMKNILGTPAVSLSAKARTSTANGTAVDLAGYEGALVILDIGLFSDPGSSNAFKIQHSGPGAWADVGSAYYSNAFTAVASSGGDNVCQAAHYIGERRYIRVVQTITGSPSTGLVSGAVVLRGFKRHMPAT